MKTTLALLGILFCAGCSNLHDYVISATGTVIGVKIGENPQTQLYEAQLGYCRTEVALVPTNKNTTNNVAVSQGGADVVPNVIMEVRYGGIFSFTDAGIYQRLAVGDIAVQQPGAAYMFSKTGMLTNALSVIPSKVRTVISTTTNALH